VPARASFESNGLAWARRFPGRRKVTARTLVLGNWSPVVRDPLDLLRAAFVVGAVVLPAPGQSGWLPLAVASAAVIAVSFLVRTLFV
jgi:hypothetical protein